MSKTFPFFFLFFTLFVGSNTLGAQSAIGKNVGILPFKINNGQQTGAAQQLENYVYEFLVQSGRVEVIERSYVDDLEKEKWRQTDPGYIDGLIVDQTKMNGAELLLIGQIDRCDTERLVSDDGNVSYNCIIVASVRVIDVATGSVLFSDTWSNGGILEFDNGKTKEIAITKSVKSLRKDIKAFLKDHWPITGGVLSQKSGTELLIGIGSENGLQVNDRLNVFIEMNVQGRNYKEVIGEVKVSEVNGKDIATVKIKKGRSEILEALDEGAKLKLTSN